MSGQPPGVAQAHFCRPTFLARWHEALLLLWVPLGPGNGRIKPISRWLGVWIPPAELALLFPKAEEQQEHPNLRLPPSRALREPCSEAELPLVSQGLLQRINPRSHGLQALPSLCLRELGDPRRAFSYGFWPQDLASGELDHPPAPLPKQPICV